MSEEVKKGQHHYLGPSRWPALQQCPAYRPASGASGAATSGTRSHKALAAMLLASPGHEGEVEAWADNREWLSGVAKAAVSGLTDDEFVRAARCAACVMRMRRGGEDGGTAKFAAAGPLHVEETLEIDDGDSILTGIFGTPDAWWATKGGRAVILDYKTYGDGTVDYTAQLAGYHLCVASHHAIAAVAHYAVYNGDCADPDALRVKAYMDAAEILPDCEDIIRAALAPSPAPNVGDGRNCAYCRNCARCPAAQRLFDSVAFDFGDTATRLAVCDAAKKAAEAAIEKLKAELAEAGGECESPDGAVKWRLDTRAGKRSIDRDEIERFIRGAVIEDRDRFAASLIDTKAKAEALFKAAGGDPATFKDWFAYVSSEGSPVSVLKRVK